MDFVLLQRTLVELGIAVLYVILSGTVVGTALVFMVPADRKTQKHRAGYVLCWGFAALIAVEGSIFFHWALWNVALVLSRIANPVPPGM